MLQRGDIHRVLRMQEAPVVDRLQNGGLALVSAFFRILCNTMESLFIIYDCVTVFIDNDL